MDLLPWAGPAKRLPLPRAPCVEPAQAASGRHALLRAPLQELRRRGRAPLLGSVLFFVVGRCRGAPGC
eukprot:3527428-Alexandrium_andersonii.AAC.1